MVCWLLLAVWVPLDGHKQFHLEEDVTLVRLWVRCTIVPQTVAYRLVDSFNKYIIQCVLGVDVCDHIEICDQVVGILSGSRAGRMHVPEDICIIFGYSLVVCAFP